MLKNRLGVVKNRLRHRTLEKKTFISDTPYTGMTNSIHVRGVVRWLQ